MKTAYLFNGMIKQDGQTKVFCFAVAIENSNNLIGEFKSYIDYHKEQYNAEIYGINAYPNYKQAKEAADRLNAEFRQQGRLIDCGKAYNIENERLYDAL